MNRLDGNENQESSICNSDVIIQKAQYGGSNLDAFTHGVSPVHNGDLLWLKLRKIWGHISYKERKKIGHTPMHTSRRTSTTTVIAV